MLECRVVKLPIPRRELHPNSRVYFRARSNFVKEARELAQMITKGLHPDQPKWKKVVVRPIFYFKVNRDRDDDGLISSLKSYIDGVVLGGLMDDDKGLKWLPAVCSKDAQNPHVELRFYHGTLKPYTDEELIDEHE